MEMICQPKSQDDDQGKKKDAEHAASIINDAPGTKQPHTPSFFPLFFQRIKEILILGITLKSALAIACRHTNPVILRTHDCRWIDPCQKQLVMAPASVLDLRNICVIEVAG